MIIERLDEDARQYEQTAAECEAAALHLKRTASHFRDGDVPRACAHSWAAFGHFVGAEQLLKELAQLHGRDSLLSYAKQHRHLAALAADRMVENRQVSLFSHVFYQGRDISDFI